MPDATPAPPGKLAMSRALGAAFLSHQVEQLEKSVSAPRNQNGNWRDRQRPHQQPSSDSKRGQLPIGGIRITTTHPHQQHQHQQKERPAAARKRAGEDAKKATAKEADVIIVDASVLVNALGQVKKWCRDGQEEIIIVPLEALNTLDLLKKGSTPTAQRARNASRVLEEQVGTNPRVRVQQDTAYVLWDQISFDEEDSNSPSTPNAAAMPSSPSPSPEWVRRTICCAQWETEHADEARPCVVLATLAKPQQQSPAAASGDASQHTEPTPSSPIPLPILPPHPQPLRHEVRAAGTLVAYWARRARLAVLEVAPSSGPDGRISPEDRRPAHHHHRGRGGHHHPAKGNGGGGMVERPPAVKAMMDVISQPSRVVRVLARGEKLDP